MAQVGVNYTVGVNDKATQSLVNISGQFNNLGLKAIAFNGILQSMNTILSPFQKNIAHAVKFQSSITEAVSGNLANFSIDGTFELSIEHATKRIKELQEGVKKQSIKIGASLDDTSLMSSLLLKKNYSIPVALEATELVNNFKTSFAVDIPTSVNFLADVSTFSGVSIASSI